jgi:hypothetical protein
MIFASHNLSENGRCIASNHVPKQCRYGITYVNHSRKNYMLCLCISYLLVTILIDTRNRTSNNIVYQKTQRAIQHLCNKTSKILKNTIFQCKMRHISCENVPENHVLKIPCFVRDFASKQYVFTIINPLTTIVYTIPIYAYPFKHHAISNPFTRTTAACNP